MKNEISIEAVKLLREKAADIPAEILARETIILRALIVGTIING